MMKHFTRVLILSACLIQSFAFADQFSVDDEVVDTSPGGPYAATIVKLYSNQTAELKYAFYLLESQTVPLSVLKLQR